MGNKKPEPPVDLWEKLEREQERLRIAKSPPPGVFSVYDYMVRYQVNRTTARSQLGRLEEKGVVERAGLFLKDGKVVTFYRLKAS